MKDEPKVTLMEAYMLMQAAIRLGQSDYGHWVMEYIEKILDEIPEPPDNTGDSDE